MTWSDLRWSQTVENVRFDGIKFLFSRGKHFRCSGARFRQFIPKISSSGVQLPVWRKLIPGISCEVNFLPHWTPPHAGLIFSGILFLGKLKIFPKDFTSGTTLPKSYLVQMKFQELGCAHACLDYHHASGKHQGISFSLRVSFFTVFVTRNENEDNELHPSRSASNALVFSWRMVIIKFFYVGPVRKIEVFRRSHHFV